jgi:hypothetical protein
MICALCACEFNGEYIKTIDNKIYEIDCIKRYYSGRKTDEEIKVIINKLTPNFDSHSLFVEKCIKS